MLVAGHICVDLFPELRAAPEIIPGRLTEVGPLSMAPGGCVANTGLALSGLGALVRMAADAGDDFLGRLLQDTLSRQGVDAQVRLRAGASTSYSIVIQPPGGDRSFWHHAGANESFNGSDLRLEGARVLHLGYPPLLPALYRNGAAQLVNLFTSARQAGVLTSMDMATVDVRGPSGSVDWTRWLEEVLVVTDVFTPSIDDVFAALPARRLDRSPQTLRKLGADFVRAGPAVVMIKLGDQGLYLRTGAPDRIDSALGPGHRGWANRELWAPPLSVEVASTTGAGDSATGGLLFGILSGWDPEDALTAAASAAASRIESGRVGGWAELSLRLETGWAHVELTEPGWVELQPGIYSSENQL